MRLSNVLSHSAVIFLFIVVSFVKSQASVNYRLSSDIVPTVYDLHIEIDLDNWKFNGTETIHVHTNQATSKVQLHLLDLSLNEVQVIEGEIAIPITSTDFNNETQIFELNLAQSLIQNRDYQIKTKFEGEIGDDMTGLYRSSYYENGVVKYIATTFSAAAYARKIFPCFDEPAFKAQFNLTITNKNNFFALANTPSTNIETNEEWRTTTFEISPVMSTYLLAFTVSEFRGNVKISDDLLFSVYSSQKSLDSMKFALDTGEMALRALEEYIGHNYTLSKMDFIAIDDFLMGAMENWGLVMFKSSKIMSPEGKTTRRKLQQITTIISHELVHMFFGNLVTCDYWDYVWLNEGFATYLQDVIADKILPHWRTLDYFIVNRMHAAMRQDVAPKTHPMTRTVNSPSEISKIYDFVAYPKAASVIRMIEHIMSPEVFRKALEVYIHERSFQTATEAQLFEVLERMRPEGSSNSYPPIPDIFRTWSNNPGYPILNVHTSFEDKSIEVSQELFVPFINTTEPSGFSIVFNYATSSSGARGFDSTSPRALQPLSDSDRWVIFNIQQTGYFRVNYDERNWHAIIDELHGENFNSIHELNRAQLLDDSFNLARYDYLDFKIALDLIKYLHQEQELIPLTAGFKSIEFLLTFLDEQVFYSDLRDMLLNIVDEIYVRINNDLTEVTAEEEDYHVLRKSYVNTFACKFGAKSCLTDTSLKLFLFDFEFNEFDTDERSYLYCGGLSDDLGNFNWIQLRTKVLAANGNQEYYRANQEEFNEIFHAFSACDRNLQRIERLLDDIFNYSEDISSYENISKDNALEVVENLIKISSAHRSLWMNFYSSNFQAVSAKFSFDETLAAFGEAINSASHLQRFITLAATAGVNATETIEKIERNIEWLAVKAPEIEMWVTGGSVGLKASVLAIVALFSLVVWQYQLH